MVIIQNIDDNTFLFNNRKYIKKYLVLKLGNTHIAIHNVYDVRLQLLESTHFSQVQVDGNIHDSQAALMSVLAPMLFNNGTNTSGSTQNNRGIYFQYGIINGEGDITPSQLATFVNSQDYSFVVSETTTPTLFEVLRTNNGITKKFIFIFLQGKGNWGSANGANPSPVYPSFFKLISVQNLTPDDIVEDENNNINYLGEIPDDDFLNVANASEWAFTGATDQYYFSYTQNDVLYFALFVGEPDVYGGGGMDTNDFSESDFVITTNSDVQPAILPTGLEAINEGNGIGWRLVGRNPTNYGNIGLNAVDISVSTVSGNTYGALGEASFAGGSHNSITGPNAIGFGQYNVVASNNSVAIGLLNLVNGNASIALGQSNTSSGNYSIAAGSGNQATGYTSTAIGNNNRATDFYSVALGTNNKAGGYASIALGNSNAIQLGGDYSMAVNSENIITGNGDYSFVGGRSNVIASTYSASFGSGNNLSGTSSFVAGSNNLSLGSNSFAVGSLNNVTATHAFAGGNGNTASGQWSTVFGLSNTAASVYETVIGYNAVNLGGNSAAVQSGDTVFRVGIGSNNSARADAFRIYKSGLITAPSSTISGITNGDVKSLITKEYLQANSGSTGVAWGQ